MVSTRRRVSNERAGANIVTEGKSQYSIGSQTGVAEGSSRRAVLKKYMRDTTRITCIRGARATKTKVLVI